MISVLLSRLVLLVFGTLYPAYASYKTVKTKNVRDYVKWMMYWIVFAVYTFVEIFADIFVAFWFPFYYELKIFFVLWLMCPATRGSTYIFRKLINPQLSKHEALIDSYIASLWEQGYDVARKIGAQGVDYLIEVFLELLRK
ncbi:receptor expression-enhancing protein 4-like, partial [Stegodyphus dumicola]|uniref:receptor expression-enhancing protein 4-like n=1 Tax=Stegodyphus dumicola TaxID=202533 RepID=UPI0015B311C9